MYARFPRFSSSDNDLNITYRYRCELYNRHIRLTPAGYVITEFLPDVPWAGIYNTISCAAGHHFREGRWMADTSPLEEYAAFWCTVGNPRLYSFPIADSINAFTKVTGKTDIADALYPQLARIHREWDDHRLSDGMYQQMCGCDGMEYSLSGDGCRPTINSYMVADKRALSLLAERHGDFAAMQEYDRDADTLTKQIRTRLWNEEIGMYGVVSDDGIPQSVRELIGYIPWIYGIAEEGQDGCFAYLLDSDCFLSPYGLRTADASHPSYRTSYDHECLWNGPIWPFATAQTLTAVIAYLQTAEHPTITPKDFTALLLTYARSHRDTDGSPYLDENMDPDTGVWLAREILRGWGRSDQERGRHYNHSSFIDLVITGICGIRPDFSDTLIIQPLGLSLEYFTLSDVRYHGHDLTIDWNQKTGLRVWVDGNEVCHCEPTPDLCVTIKL